MHIIGIDPGLRNTSYAVMYNGKLITVGDITTNPKESLGKSLHDIEWKFCRGVMSIDPKYNIMAIEEVYFAPRMRTIYRETSAVIGLFAKIAYEHEIECVPVSPSAIKKYITGKGNANKDNVMKAVQERLRDDLEMLGLITSHHRADAVAIAMYINEEQNE